MSITRVARAANVSYATAWRVINNQACSSQETVAAVQQAMRALGYAPGSSRRGRKPKGADGVRTHNIALLHLREGTSISATVLNSVQRLIAERNLNLIFARINSPDDLPQAVRAGNVDGIVGYGEFPAAAVSPRLKRIPAVWLMSRSNPGMDAWGDRVRPDHQEIGQLAARVLQEKGHTHLGFMNPDPNVPVCQQRLAAFRGAVERPGAPFSVFSSATADLEGAATQLVDQWMSSSSRPTGVFVPVDRATLRIHRELQRRGIRIGTDIDLVSCDNEQELLSLMNPQPVSLDINRETIARLGIERLFWRMRNGMSSPQVVVTVSPGIGKFE
jgi:LacI family transcriptional regulator